MSSRAQGLLDPAREHQVGHDGDDPRHARPYRLRRSRNSLRTLSGRPHICTTSARPSWMSLTRSSPSIPSRSSVASVPRTVSGAAAWPKLCATLSRQCQSALEYGCALIWVRSHPGVDVARLVGDPQVELDVGPVVGKRLDDPAKSSARAMHFGAEHRTRSGRLRGDRQVDMMGRLLVDRHPHRLGDGPAEHPLSTGEAHRDRSPERLPVDDADRIPRGDARAPRGIEASPGSESEMRTSVPRSPGCMSLSRRVSGSSISSSAVGIGSPCGSRVGSPRKRAISSSSSSEITCSSRSASSWTRSHGIPRPGEERLDQAMVAQHLEREASPCSVRRTP